MMKKFLLLLVVGGFVANGGKVGHAVAADIPPEQLKFFETHVRPALVKYCYECHSAEAGDRKSVV